MALAGQLVRKNPIDESKSQRETRRSAFLGGGIETSIATASATAGKIAESPESEAFLAQPISTIQKTYFFDQDFNFQAFHAIG